MFQFNGYVFSRNDLNKLQGYLNDYVAGFISAFRPEYKDSKHEWPGENSDRQRSLGKSLGALGLGYVVLEGHWQDPGGNYEKEHWGDFAGGHDEVEKTFAVLNNSPKKYSPSVFINILRSAAEAYGQAAVMVVAPKSGGVRDGFGNWLLAGHGYYYEEKTGYEVPVDMGTFHADMVGDWVEANGEVVGRGFSKTPGRKGRTFVFNYFDFNEAREHIFNTLTSAVSLNSALGQYQGDPVNFFRGPLNSSQRFSFFAHDSHPRLVFGNGGQAYRDSKTGDREWRMFWSGKRSEEYEAFQDIRAVVSSGAGMGRILQHLENYDIAFISAFLTGENPDAGGYGLYKEGEVGPTGNVHKAGDKVSGNENRRNNKSLAAAIKMAGYGFVKVKGTYGGEAEETFCVINVAEDSGQFAEAMHQLGNMYKQDSVLICPKGGVPYFFYFDGRRESASTSKPNVLNAAVEDYFTQIKGKKFNFNFSSLSFVEMEKDEVGFFNKPSLTPLRQGMVLASVDSFRKRLLSGSFDGISQERREGQVSATNGVFSGVRGHTKSRRGVSSGLPYVGFDQWEGAIAIYSSLGVQALRSWLILQGYTRDAEESVLRDLKQTLSGTAPGSTPIASSTGPRSLAAWRLYEKAQKLKAGGLTYKETVSLLAKEAGVLPKEVKDIIGTSSEWLDGVFDYGLEPLHPDEEEMVKSKADRAFSEETRRIYASVVAKQDPIKEQFLSGQINLIGAIDELAASGMDYEEAEEVARGWLPK